MKPLLGIALVLALGYLATHRWFGRGTLGPWSRFFYLTGEEFLLVGILLGPHGTVLLDRSTLVGLEPFVGLGLGYIGFVFGMQFTRDGLSRVPGRHYAASLTQAALVALALGAALWLWFREHPGMSSMGPGPLVLALVATGVGTSTSFLYLVERQGRLGRSDLFRFMRFSSVFDDLWGVILFGVALCWMQGATAQWLGVSVGLGVLGAAVLSGCLSEGMSAREELLVLVGVALFTGGVATYLRLSPVLTNTVAGAVFANLRHDSDRVHVLLLRVEKPIYLFMLVVAGALASFRLEGVLALLAVYVGARAVGKWLGGGGAGQILGAGWGPGGRFGLGLTAQSEMSVALMVNLIVLQPGPAVQVGVSAVFLAVVVNDLASSVYFARRTGRGGT